MYFRNEKIFDLVLVNRVAYLGGNFSGKIYRPWQQNMSILHGVDNSLARPGRKQANVSVRMTWISFGALPCKEKKNLMTARVSMLLKSRASLTYFRAYSFLVGLRTYQHPCNILSTCKAPKEIHAILTETLACFLPRRTKDLSAPL